MIALLSLVKESPIAMPRAILLAILYSFAIRVIDTATTIADVAD